ATRTAGAVRRQPLSAAGHGNIAGDGRNAQTQVERVRPLEKRRPDIAPRRRRGRGVKEALVRKSFRLSVLSVSAVNDLFLSVKSSLADPSLRKMRILHRGGAEGAE